MYFEGLLLVGAGIGIAQLVENRELVMQFVCPPAAKWAGWLYAIRIVSLAQLAVFGVLGLSWPLFFVQLVAFLMTFTNVDFEQVGKTEQETVAFYKRKVINALAIYGGAIVYSLL